jgi:hypothetical protein
MTDELVYYPLEQNILMGLKDTPTLTELAVLALYALSVSFPYMRVARGLTNGRHINALDMGPFHAKVITFCKAVADNPDLLLAPDTSYKTGTLDGQVWEHPEAFYVNPTNDHNKGESRQLRAAMRQWASLSLNIHNTKSKYAVNGTREFLQSAVVTQALQVWLRGEAHREVDSGTGSQE